ncbi:MAG: DUF4397 domain-containing protein [Mucilaginibacter sp.]|uniref:DUF4397 domain-containing protein n=1 Tax=Mucilaginibacter sp. TaxID=1882438 RepID=UPI0034E4D1C4
MKPPKPYLKATAFVLISVFMLAFSSCTKEDTSTDTDLGNAHLIVINSTKTAPAIDFYWTGNKLNVIPLAFGTTTGYRTVTSGTRNIQIKANLTNALLATNTIKVVRDSSYTFFVFDANGVATTAIAEDDLSMPSFGNAKIKFANMSSGLSAADLAIVNGPVIASSVSFGMIGNYTELKAGTYNLVLREHGTNKTMLNIPNVRVDNSKIYTIWSAGTVNGTGSLALSTQTFAR